MKKVIEKDLMLDIFKRAGYCRSRDTVRTHIQGMLLIVTYGGIRAIATDGHRLAVWDKLVDDSDENVGSVILHGPVLDFIWDQYPLLEQLIIRTKGEEQLPTIVKLETGKVTFDLEPYDFPEHERVIPTTYDCSAIGNVKDIKRALNGMSRAGYEEAYIFSEEGRMKIAGNRSTKKEITKGTHSGMLIIGELIKHPPEDTRLGINMKYLYQSLKSLNTPECEIKVLGPLDPIVIENDNSKHVIMPMRI